MKSRAALRYGQSNLDAPAVTSKSPAGDSINSTRRLVDDGRIHWRRRGTSYRHLDAPGVAAGLAAKPSSMIQRNQRPVNAARPSNGEWPSQRGGTTDAGLGRMAKPHSPLRR